MFSINKGFRSVKYRNTAAFYKQNVTLNVIIPEHSISINSFMYKLV